MSIYPECNAWRHLFAFFEYIINIAQAIFSAITNHALWSVHCGVKNYTSIFCINDTIIDKEYKYDWYRIRRWIFWWRKSPKLLNIPWYTLILVTFPSPVASHFNFLIFVCCRVHSDSKWCNHSKSFVLVRVSAMCGSSWPAVIGKFFCFFLHFS